MKPEILFQNLENSPEKSFMVLQLINFSYNGNEATATYFFTVAGPKQLFKKLLLLLPV